MIMERQIGERFNYKGIMLEVVKGESCRNCYFSKNCKNMKIIISIGTRRKDCFLSVFRERNKYCAKDDDAIRIAGYCEPFWRSDNTAINYKKVKESLKDKLVRFFTTMARSSKL